jgi:hypothetical protein
LLLTRCALAGQILGDDLYEWREVPVEPEPDIGKARHSRPLGQGLWNGVKTGKHYA